MKAEVANIVLERAGHYCEACGMVGSDFALHHRKLRSQGGLDAPSNLIAVHHGCHNLGTHSIHLNPKAAIAKGQIVPSWADPLEFPLTLSDGNVVRLDNEGNYLEIEGSDGTDRSNW